MKQLFYFIMILFSVGFGIQDSFAETSEFITSYEYVSDNNGVSGSSNISYDTAIVDLNSLSLQEDTMNITVFGQTLEITHEKTITRSSNDFTILEVHLILQITCISHIWMVL